MLIVKRSSTIPESSRRITIEIHAAPTADGVERVLFPGEREWTLHRQAQATGIDLPPDVVAKLSQAAEIVGLAADFGGDDRLILGTSDEPSAQYDESHHSDDGLQVSEPLQGCSDAEQETEHGGD